MPGPPPQTSGRAGFSLVELIVVTALLAVLATAALPLLDIADRREREERLRRALLETRGALDRFNLERNAFPYALSELATTPARAGGYFLRRVPVNPMATGPTWEVASTGALTGTWETVTASGAGRTDGLPIQDVRYPKSMVPADAINGSQYSDW